MDWIPISVVGFRCRSCGISCDHIVMQQHVVPIAVIDSRVLVEGGKPKELEMTLHPGKFSPSDPIRSIYDGEWVPGCPSCGASGMLTGYVRLLGDASEVIPIPLRMDRDGFLELWADGIPVPIDHWDGRIYEPEVADADLDSA